MASHGWIAGGGAPRTLVILAALFVASPAAAQTADRWSGHIGEASARFGVPAEWIRRMMRAESGGRAMLDGRPIVSPAGAIGLMQLMPGTWREMRAAHALGPDPHDPRDNILAGTAYLRAMYDRFGYPGLFAAYNAGPRHYAEHLTTGRSLPAQTVAYVAAIGPALQKRSAASPKMRQEGSIFVALADFALRGEAASPPSARNPLFVRLSAPSAVSE